MDSDPKMHPHFLHPQSPNVLTFVPPCAVFDYQRAAFDALSNLFRVRGVLACLHYAKYTNYAGIPKKERMD